VKDKVPSLYIGARAAHLNRYAMKFTLAAILIAMLASIDVSAKEAQFTDILGKCWKGHDHLQMSKCVRSRAAEAQARLSDVVAELRKGIAASEESAGYSKSGAIEALETSIKAFQEYRTRECAVVFTVASTGNGAEDNRIACEAQLNGERAAQLKAASWWVRGDSSRNKSLERTRDR
jgi:uncharacterized protein YecT (DUF1311 family)